VLIGIRKKSQIVKPVGDRKAGAITASGAFERRCLTEAAFAESQGRKPALVFTRNASAQQLERRGL